MIDILTVFILAIFVGNEIINKVPPTLHTPLMSGSNAISGIAIVGAIIATKVGGGLGPWLGFIAVIFATMANGATMVSVSVLVQPIESETNTVYNTPPLRLVPVGPLPPVGDHW